MKNNMPKVSIGLPVYNGENYIEECIRSILAQTYSNLELVISDNASTDRTEEICKHYAAQDSRIRYIREVQNHGAAWNFNRVFKISTGEYFKWAAHDDLMAPDLLKKCVAVLDQDPNAVIAYPQVYIVDEKGEFLFDYSIKLRTDSRRPRDRFKDLLLAWSLCFEVFGLIRSSALHRTPLMGNYGHGDGVLLARLSLLGYFIEVPEKLFFSRKHAQQSQRIYGKSEAGGNDYHKYSVWFDPNKANRVIFPNWTILWQFVVSLWMYPMPQWDRLLCHLYFIVYLRRAARSLLQDLWIAQRQVVRRVLRNENRISKAEPTQRESY